MQSDAVKILKLWHNSAHFIKMVSTNLVNIEDTFFLETRGVREEKDKAAINNCLSRSLFSSH